MPECAKLGLKKPPAASVHTHGDGFSAFLFAGTRIRGVNVSRHLQGVIYIENKGAN